MSKSADIDASVGLTRAHAAAAGIALPEVILARLLGLRAAAMSAVTIMAAGLSDVAISHDHTKAMVPLGAVKLERILWQYRHSLR